MFTQSAYVSFKKSSQLFCKYLHNSATKHLICRTQDLNFFHLKNLGGFRETFGYVSLSEKRAKKRTSKGQLISKHLLRVSNSPKKRTQKLKILP